MPLRIASTVDLPISVRGSAISIFGSLAARSVSASIEISAPGRNPPVLGDFLLFAGKHPEVRLRISDVDDEQHGGGLSVRSAAARQGAHPDQGRARRARPPGAPRPAQSAPGRALAMAPART